MVVSEEQAKKKICPHTSFRFQGAPEVLCMASRCMWWKWVMKHEGNYPYTIVQSRDQGYCGMANGHGY